MVEKGRSIKQGRGTRAEGRMAMKSLMKQKGQTVYITAHREQKIDKFKIKGEN